MAERDDINGEINRLKEDMANLRSDMRDLLSAVKEAGVDRGHAAYERVRETGQKARHQAREAQEHVGEYIEEKPLTSMLVAFGTGFVIGMLLDRRD